jgi:hypothetical protein
MVSAGRSARFSPGSLRLDGSDRADSGYGNRSRRELGGHRSGGELCEEAAARRARDDRARPGGSEPRERLSKSFLYRKRYDEGGRHHRAESLSHRAPGPEQESFGRRAREAKCLCHLSVPQSVDVSQHDGLSLPVRQIRERAPQRLRLRSTPGLVAGIGDQREIVVAERQRPPHPGGDARSAFVAGDRREPRALVTHARSPEESARGEELLRRVLGVVCSGRSP